MKRKISLGEIIGALAIICVVGVAWAGTTNFDTVQCDAINVGIITAESSSNALGVRVPLNFDYANAGTYETDYQTCGRSGSNEVSSVPSYRMPWAGSIIAISAVASAANSTGTKKYYARINGVNTALYTQMVTGETTSQTTTAEGTYTFAAGSTIEARYISKGSVTPEGVDTGITIWVTQ